MGNEEMKEVNVESIEFDNAEDTSYMFNNCKDLELSEEDLNLEDNINTDFMFNKKLIEEIKSGAKTDKNLTFYPYTYDENGKYVLNKSIGTDNPIYYYKGNSTYNNVKFANYCWKIVRTTETGGIKLLLQGKTCEKRFHGYSPKENYLETAFNAYDDSPAYAGYMYGDVYKVSTKALNDISIKYVYGNDVRWDGNKYTLVTTNKYSWPNESRYALQGFHYTCFNTTGVCEDVYYINFFGDTKNAYYITLSNGKKLEDAKKDMVQNTTDSTIKTAIDNWYKENLINHTKYLEDAVWCNDRTIANGPLFSKNEHSDSSNVFSRSLQLIFGDGDLTLNCSNKNDSFTVDSKNGNGALTYPVGLLTADEIIYISGSESYITPGTYQWTMTPSHFSNYRQSGIRTAISPTDREDQVLDYETVTRKRYARPAISLKPGTEFTVGTGTITDPYIIAE